MKPVAAGFLFSALACAADLTGTWTGHLPPRANAKEQAGVPLDGPDIVFKFAQSGTSLSGKQYGDYKSVALIDGHVEGDSIKFEVAMPEQAGSQTNTARYSYTGTLNGDELTLTRERRSSVNVGNGEIAPNRNTAPQKIVLKRLI